MERWVMEIIIARRSRSASKTTVTVRRMRKGKIDLDAVADALGVVTPRRR